LIVSGKSASSNEQPYIKRWRMTKKDEKDPERPHYYSQFWLDVAAGRRVIGAPKSDEGADLEADLPEPTPIARRGGRVTATAPVDGYKETRTAAVAEPDYAEDELTEPDEDALDLVTDLDDEDIPNIVVDDTLEEASDNLEVAPADEEPDEDEEFFDEEEEEEEDEEEWPARGRKKPKPGRAVKAPKPPVKKPKRGPRF
jgi:hypothetical protein